MYPLPLSTGTIVMQASTGQVISHRLQPMHADAITSYLLAPARHHLDVFRHLADGGAHAALGHVSRPHMVNHGGAGTAADCDKQLLMTTSSAEKRIPRRRWRCSASAA